MFASADNLTALPLARTTVSAAPARPVSLEAVAVLAVFVLAGLVWMTIGWMVMRSAAEPGLRRRLQGLAVPSLAHAREESLHWSVTLPIRRPSWAALTWITWPSAMSPASSFLAMGSTSSFWITRFRGRAP